MQVVIAGIAVFGAAGIIMFLSTLGMGGGFKAAIVTVAVLVAVYCLARIQPSREPPEKDTGK
jgi:hypothetical protein